MLSLPKENPHLGSWVGKFLWSVAGFPWYHVDIAVSFTFIPLWYRNIWPQKIGMPRPNELLVMKANVWAPDSVANGNSTSDGGNGKGQIHPSKMNENGKKETISSVRSDIYISCARWAPHGICHLLCIHRMILVMCEYSPYCYRKSTEWWKKETHEILLHRIYGVTQRWWV